MLLWLQIFGLLFASFNLSRELAPACGSSVQTAGLFSDLCLSKLREP